MTRIDKKTTLPTGMGVQFLDLTLADMDAIPKYIKSKPGTCRGKEEFARVNVYYRKELNK